jgi:hypothetical protein
VVSEIKYNFVFPCTVGGKRRLYNEELHHLYVLPNIISDQVKEDEMYGHVARMDAMKNAHKILVGKPEAKRPLGRPTCGWEDNIRTSCRLDVSGSGQRPVAGCHEPSGSLKGGELLD